ncbi:MAG: hypothetical protein SO434_04255 [Eubacteriales bacterium]|nr:hypothetical protein [Eubacteriales bacterium]
MANRHLLAVNKLEDFKQWLIRNGWHIEEPKNIYEVLRARKEGEKYPFIAYQRIKDNLVHLSLSDYNTKIVREYLGGEEKMTKQEQIEEMAKVLSTVKRCEALALSECIKKKCEYPHYEGVTCIAEHQAETLYEQGYRKLPKDSVVLTREEYEVLKVKAKEKHWLGTCIAVWENAKIDASKETAKELLNKFRGLLVDIGFTYMFSKDTSMIGVTLEECVGELNKMFKQYNVEVEE